MAHLDRIDAIVMCCDGDGYFTHASCAHEMAALWTFLTDKLCNRATPLIHGTQTDSKGKCELEQILALLVSLLQRLSTSKAVKQWRSCSLAGTRWTSERLDWKMNAANKHAALHHVQQARHASKSPAASRRGFRQAPTCLVTIPSVRWVQVRCATVSGERRDRFHGQP